MAEYLGFSVALVDLDLKGKDGLSLIDQLHESFPDLPIIAISSMLAEAEPRRAKKEGVVEVLQKPITPEWKAVVERIRAMRRR